MRPRPLFLFTALIAASAAATPVSGQCEYRAPAPRILVPGEPPPPPPPIIDPIILFFGRGSAALSPNTQAILQHVVRAYGESSATGVALAAHTDTRGSPASNLRLAQRRAAAVIAYLRARLPRFRAELCNWGESRPLVPTADEVDEAQNRRVEIIFLPIPR